MRADIVPFKKEHALYLCEAVPSFKQYLTLENVTALEASRYAFTALDKHRGVVGCAGLIEYWTGRAEAWAMFRPDRTRYFMSIHRAARNFLAICPHNRVEATVSCNYANAHRWVKLLGFQMEGERLRRYNPDGSDASLYAKVK